MSMEMSKEVQGKTKSGLRYYILPMEGFQEKMAAVVVKAGANHIFWRDTEGKERTFPKGTAHFIEHKLFQQEWGDAFTRFTEQGASANAFTDGDKTVYYFTCRDGFAENLRLLLDFVQKPVFTPEDTEKEKSIIASEIAMYDDDPDWVAYYQLLNGMYRTHPVKNPVAGAKETVEEVKAETLRQAYAAYYTTENMSLVCAGDVSARQVQAMAEKVGRRATEWRAQFPQEPDGEIVEKYRERKMGLATPCFQIGFKLPAVAAEEQLQSRIAMNALLEILAGESSDFFRMAYEKGILDEPPGGAYFCGEGYAFAALSGTGERPEETAGLLGKALERLKREGISWADFERVRKKMLGRLLRKMDSVGGLCMGQVEWAAAADASAAEVLRQVKAMKKEDAEKMLQNRLTADTMVLSVVK